MEENEKSEDELRIEGLDSDIEKIDPTDMGGMDHDVQIIELDDLEVDWVKSRGKKKE
ncbi:hypothetical protein [Reichenbachiella sp. 5M10]|uniref:hypothetical protein n=1 Tax=Reichenbachiella sp. 5M10 TaxID=1889772 RepID=UPI0013044DA5|nr:hypothetical protein [Reichenbachiella sp. 5M10]